MNDSIVKKLKETRSCIYLTWINERLSTKLILEVSKVHSGLCHLFVMDLIKVAS